MRKYLSLILSLVVFSVCYADHLEKESIRTTQYQQHLESQRKSEPVILSSSPPQEKIAFPFMESTCFPISHISLAGDHASQFSFLLPNLTRRLNFQSEPCLGVKSVQYMQQTAQNILIEKGFITSQIAIEDQDLTTKSLVLTVYPSYVDRIQFHESGHQLTELGRQSIFPLHAGQILQLTHLEQGLENLQRLSGVRVEMDIVPASLPNHSNIVVKREQAKQFEMSVGVNSFGSKRSGKYQAEGSLSVLSLLGLSNLLYLQYGQDIGHHKTKLTDSAGTKTDSGTKNYYLHYALPFGYWHWQTNYSLNRYDDANEGMYRHYNYQGKNYHFNSTLSRVLYRDNHQKFSTSFKLWHNKIQKFLDKTEIDVQRRKMSGWQSGIDYLHLKGNYSLEIGLHYKRGIGFQSLPAPEEFNTHDDILQGTSRMKIISATLHQQYAFALGSQSFSLDQHVYAQWHKTPLVPQDKLALGGYYSVRGFDGDNPIQGERGWYAQHNLHWHYHTNHKSYIGWDYGRVSGLTGKLQEKQQISGAILGFSGNYRMGKGTSHYHIFVAKPLMATESKAVFGFNTQYVF